MQYQFAELLRGGGCSPSGCVFEGRVDISFNPLENTFLKLSNIFVGLSLNQEVLLYDQEHFLPLPLYIKNIKLLHNIQTKVICT